MLAPVRHRDDFDVLSRSRARGRSGPIRVTRAPLPHPGPPRIAYAIPRSVGTAVVRNRIRRRLRAMIADLDTAGTLAPGLYLVGVAPGAADQPATELRRHLVAAVESAQQRSGHQRAGTA